MVRPQGLPYYYHHIRGHFRHTDSGVVKRAPLIPNHRPVAPIVLDRVVEHIRHPANHRSLYAGYMCRARYYQNSDCRIYGMVPVSHISPSAYHSYDRCDNRNGKAHCKTHAHHRAPYIQIVDQCKLYAHRCQRHPHSQLKIPQSRRHGHKHRKSHRKHISVYAYKPYHS